MEKSKGSQEVGGEKGSVQRRNCGGETEGRAYFKACARFYVTRTEGLGKTRER